MTTTRLMLRVYFDAESWLGEYWKPLLAGGAEQVRLFEDATEIYGPMSLKAAEEA